MFDTAVHAHFAPFATEQSRALIDRMQASWRAEAAGGG
jgi:hypothetical protein